MYSHILEKTGDTNLTEYSDYVLSELGMSRMDEEYLSSYSKAVQLGDMVIAGQYLEKMMHIVFIRLAGNDADPFDGAIQITGKACEGVCQIRNGKCWIPSVPNFAAFDASALRSDGKITYVQSFAGKRHGFEQRAFTNSFLNHIPGEANANTFDSLVTSVFSSYQKGEPMEINLESRVDQIDVTTMETVLQSAVNVFEDTTE